MAFMYSLSPYCVIKLFEVSALGLIYMIVRVGTIIVGDRLGPLAADGRVKVTLCLSNPLCNAVYLRRPYNKVTIGLS